MRLFFLKPSILFSFWQWSRFSRVVSRLGGRASYPAAIGAKCPAAVAPIGQLTHIGCYGFDLILALAIGHTTCAQTSGSQTVRLGSTTIQFRHQCGALPQPGVQYVHVHENEATAVQAAKAHLKTTKRGCFVTWVGQNDRYVQFVMDGQTFKFDPNRIYTEQGAQATLKAQGPFTPAALQAVRRAAAQFASQYVDTLRLVVALHNNTDAGGLSIASYQPGGNESINTKLVHRSKTWDADDFFYTTSDSMYHYFAKRDFNIVLQDNAKVVDDGSLSVYAGYKGIAYLNVEAEHGHRKQQLKMLAAVDAYIKTHGTGK